MIDNTHRETWAAIISAGVILLLADAFFMQHLDLFANICWLLYVIFTAIVLFAKKK